METQKSLKNQTSAKSKDSPAGLLAHATNPSTWEADEVGDLCVYGQPGPHSEFHGRELHSEICLKKEGCRGEEEEEEEEDTKEKENEEEEEEKSRCWQDPNTTEP